MKFSSILIGSQDPKRLGDFYGQVLDSKPGWEQGGFIGYDVGGWYLMVGPHDKVHGPCPNPERILINFETDNFEADFKRIKQIDGGKVLQEPYHPDEAAKMSLATLIDPDGNYFQLATPMG